MNSIILQTENLEKSFSTEYGMHRVLKGISVVFFQGDFTAIMGESGSGKSTLLYALSGMDTPTGGRVLSAGKNLVNMNVMDNILISGLLGSNKKKEVIHAAERLLNQVGIAPDARTKYPSQISGGMAQRVGIVRALINSPELLFADEPTGALDSQSSKEVLDIFTSFNRAGQSIIMVTHDIKTAIRANRILYLKDGNIVGESRLEPYGMDDFDRINKVNEFLEAMRW